MSWLARWFSPSKQKRGSDDDIQGAPGKRARMLFPQAGALDGGFTDDETLLFEAKHATGFDPLASSVLVPRPLALVASLDKTGELCLTTTDHCALVSTSPPCICLGLEKDVFPEEAPTEPTDSILETRELTLSVVSEWFADAASASVGTYELPSGTTEADLKTGLTTSPSKQVKVPRISEAAVALECKLRHRHAIKDKSGEITSYVFIVEVVCTAIKAGVLAKGQDGHKVVDIHKLRPVASLGNDTYGRVSSLYTASTPTPAAPDTPPGSAEPAPAEGVVGAVAEAVAEALAGDPEGGSNVVAVEVTLAENTAEVADDDIPVTVTQQEE